MPNSPIQAAAEGLPKITRRLFLRNTAAAGMAGATVAASSASVQAAPALSPDARIYAALEEIKAAYQEKFPGSALRIGTNDEDGTEFIMVVPQTNSEKTGQVTYVHNCVVVRQEGGAA